MRRAATPLRNNNNLRHDDDESDEDAAIPLTVLELSAPPSPQIHQVDAGNEDGEKPRNGNQSPSVSIHVIDEGGENGKDVPEKLPPPRKQSDDNDTSWQKIKKKTSPVVNASVVLMYLVMSSMFVFGWVSLNSCTVNPWIPVYLIVAGSTGILTKALIRTRNKYLFNVVILLVLFDLCWQAFGSYMVYSEYQPNYDAGNGQPYCHRVAYLLAFWIITIVYSLIGLFILLSCCYFLMRNTFRKT